MINTNEENKSQNIKDIKENYLILDTKFENLINIKKDFSIEEIFEILKVNKAIKNC